MKPHLKFVVLHFDVRLQVIDLDRLWSQFRLGSFSRPGIYTELKTCKPELYLTCTGNIIWFLPSSYFVKRLRRIQFRLREVKRSTVFLAFLTPSFNWHINQPSTNFVALLTRSLRLDQVETFTSSEVDFKIKKNWIKQLFHPPLLQTMAISNSVLRFSFAVYQWPRGIFAIWQL